MTFVAKVFDPKKLVQDYGDVVSEVEACRESSVVFDFSFMSVVRVTGTRVEEFFSQLTDRNLKDFKEGRIRYALCRDNHGWLRSDLTIWKESVDNFLVMSGLGTDLSDLANNFEIKYEDVVVYSVQGPEALFALSKITDIKLLKTLPYFGFTQQDVAGVKCYVGRLGYTGELGFEIVASSKDGRQLWRSLIKYVKPAGFVAANCLRIEAGFILFANEFKLPVTAEEAGLKAFSDNDLTHPRYRLVSFRAKKFGSQSICSNIYDVVAPVSGSISITSACHSNIAKGILGLGYVLFDEAIIGTYFIDPTGQYKDIQIVHNPFYDTKKIRPRVILL
jgi:glycine cleavage system aminomethyltransferase T